MQRLLIVLLAIACALCWAPRAQAQQTVQCASVDGTLSHCAVDASGGAFLQRQHSRAACIQDATWGYDRNGIWVTGGCRGTFLVGAPRQSRVAERNAAIAVVALLAGAFVWAARQDQPPAQQDADASNTFEAGCLAARDSLPVPDDASDAFRRGHATCGH